MSSEKGRDLRSLSPRRSIAGKTYFLVGLGLSASVFILVVSLAVMEVSRACTSLLKGERDHTVHLYGAFHDLARFEETGDEESLQSFDEDLAIALGLSGTFGSSLSLLQTGSTDELAEALSGFSESMSLDEARHVFRVVKFMSGNDHITGLVAQAASVHELTLEYQELGNALRMVGGDDATAVVSAQLDRLAPAIEEAVLVFNRGVTDLNEWAAGIANRLLWTGVLLILLGGAYLAWRIVGSINRSIRDVLRFSDRLSEGDFSQRLEVLGEDETSRMAEALNRLCDNLRRMIGRIAEGSANLASSLSQISSTASELAASSSQTSTAVNEISTTLEEIRQTSHLSSEKAGEVATKAEGVASVAASGEASVEDIVEGMRHIKDEMQYVAESILHLSERNKRIEAIVDAVTDLTDQSNLLSVNASIEAARAGEEGRGFSVVAQEMRSLADQSREATEQIKVIINDVQSATGTAVMATERGSNAVDRGMDLTVQARESIEALARTVVDSVDSASQIAASAQQQLLGLDELVDAMASIKDASVQNLDGTRQLESASRDLAALGRDLADLSSGFKV